MTATHEPRTGRPRVAAWSALFAAGCATAPVGAPDDGANPLYVSPASHDFEANPLLLRRITRGPHGYLRFINRRFSEDVCARFSDVTPSMPSVNLHGDAHLEQYAVTSVSRGLTDFDDSSRGPPVLDLIRFGVSLELAARQMGWEDQADEFFAVFLDGYRAALEDPDLEAPEPRFARSLRARFHQDRRAFLDWAAHVVEPVPEARRAEVRQALGPCFQRMARSRSHEVLAPDFFEVVLIGKLRLGIGSALDEKYLIRVEGPTDDPADDVILELKEVRDLSGIPCIESAARADPFRVLVGQARIAYVPYDHIGYLHLDGRTFWVHSWVMNYRELDVSEQAYEPADLAEVAFDVGVQLGRGHPNQIATPMDAELRGELAVIIRALRPRLTREVAALRRLVVDAWMRFRAEAPTLPSDLPEPPPPAP